MTAVSAGSRSPLPRWRSSRRLAWSGSRRWPPANSADVMSGGLAKRPLGSSSPAPPSRPPRSSDERRQRRLRSRGSVASAAPGLCSRGTRTSVSRRRRPRTKGRISFRSERTLGMVEFPWRNDRHVWLAVAASQRRGGRTSGMKDETEQPFRRDQASTGDPSVVRDDIDLDYSYVDDDPLDKPHEECGVFGIFAPEED